MDVPRTVAVPAMSFRPIAAGVLPMRLHGLLRRPLGPEDYSPPVTVITPIDHSGWITIAIALGLCFVLVFLCIRVYIRTIIGPRFGSDDTAAGLATALYVVQSAVVLIQVSKGFGKSIDLISSTALVEVQKTAFASDILYLVDLYLSKCCVLFLFMRLTPIKPHTRYLMIVLVVSTVLVIVSVFVVVLRCNPAHPWIQYNVQCAKLFLRWQIVTAFDIITEVCLFAASIYLVTNLQMAVRRKVVVVLAFASRLPVIAFAALRLHYINVEPPSANPTLRGVPAVVLTQVELGYSIVACTIPCLKPFTMATSTNFGALGSIHAMTSQASRAREFSSGSFSLAAMTSGKNRATMSGNSIMSHKEQTVASKRPVTNPYLYRGDHACSTASAMYNGQVDSRSIGSDDSTKMIIKKEVQWTIGSEFECRAASKEAVNIQPKDAERVE